MTRLVAGQRQRRQARRTGPPARAFAGIEVEVQSPAFGGRAGRRDRPDLCRERPDQGARGRSGLRLPALADDSGLVVEALGGEPGLTRPASPAARRRCRQQRPAAGAARRRAARAPRGLRFYCVLVLLRHADDPQPLIAEGIWHGRILEAPRGEGGFGYDPLFHDAELGATAAELPAGEKARVSHRGKALAKLIGALGAP
jgi:non-canonical purine NTP pyrophosphatase (RdgB/HAM1 family)